MYSTLQTRTGLVGEGLYCYVAEHLFLLLLLLPLVVDVGLPDVLLVGLLHLAATLLAVHNFWVVEIAIVAQEIVAVVAHSFWLSFADLC